MAVELLAEFGSFMVPFEEVQISTRRQVACARAFRLSVRSGQIPSKRIWKFLGKLDSPK
jgi:hypothetical protein